MRVVQQPPDVESNKRSNFLKRKCINCGSCVASCPEKAIEAVGDNKKIDRGKGAISAYAECQMLKKLIDFVDLNILLQEDLIKRTQYKEIV